MHKRTQASLLTKFDYIILLFHGHHMTGIGLHVQVSDTEQVAVNVVMNACTYMLILQLYGCRYLAIRECELVVIVHWWCRVFSDPTLSDIILPLMGQCWLSVAGGSSSSCTTFSRKTHYSCDITPQLIYTWIQHTWEQYSTNDEVYLVLGWNPYSLVQVYQMSCLFTCCYELHVVC